MSDPLDPLALLTTARETLKSLIADLPESRRYEALMTVNALAIATRILQSGDAASEGEHRALANLVDAEADPGLPALRQRLASALRQGAIDPDDPRLHRALTQAYNPWLTITNPKLHKVLGGG